MIRIIKGSYGLAVDGNVEAMRPGSAPFALSPERENELVALGVAEKLPDPPTPVTAPASSDNEPQDEDKPTKPAKGKRGKSED